MPYVSAVIEIPFLEDNGPGAEDDTVFWITCDTFFHVFLDIRLHAIKITSTDMDEIIHEAYLTNVRNGRLPSVFEYDEEDDVQNVTASHYERFYEIMFYLAEWALPEYRRLILDIHRKHKPTDVRIIRKPYRPTDNTLLLLFYCPRLLEQPNASYYTTR